MGSTIAIAPTSSNAIKLQYFASNFSFLQSVDLYFFIFTKYFYD